MSERPLYITRKEAEQFLDQGKLLTSLEEALGHFSTPDHGGINQPLRTILNVDPYEGFLGVMPGYLAYEKSLATKLVSYYPKNKNQPTHQAWILNFDPTNGNLLAIMDGEAITAIRTAVVSAIATKYLTNPDVKILALIGSGVQAKSHLHALKMVRNFQEIRVWSPTKANAEKFALEFGAKYCPTAEEAVRGADVICTITFATTPVVMNSWVKTGAHINAVGAPNPNWQELESELMVNSVVYADSRNACTKAGDILISQCEIFAEIGEVINKSKEAKIGSTTVFKSNGLALEDVVSARIVYEGYKNRNITSL